MKCWVCKSEKMEKVKDSNLSAINGTPENFRITDDNYGMTGTLHECLDCTFVQCTDFANSNEMYEQMQDCEYEAGRSVRKKEMRHILSYAESLRTFQTMLDIGAGSGILVEVAKHLGYNAIGIEPSKSLVQIAETHHLDVKQGYFPSNQVKGKFDLITLVDVIEHLNEPFALIDSLSSHLNQDGIILISTPDVSSRFARIMKWKWWHYRVAHIGYFNQKTLNLLMDRCGYINIGSSRPVWFFQGSYIANRILKLLGGGNVAFKSLKRITIRVNLHDSIMCIYQKKGKLS